MWLSEIRFSTVVLFVTRFVTGTSSRSTFQSGPYFWSKIGSISFQYVMPNETLISVIRPSWNATKTLTGVLLFPTALP